MLSELIDKLKAKKKQLQNYATTNETTESKPIAKQSDFEITISSENNIFKIAISDYISIGDYVKKMESNDELHILNLLCNCVIWNSKKQKINKGTYYVISIGNRLFNILFTDEELMIDERTKIDFDEQTQKENITEERVITFKINKNEYHYFEAKHDKTGDTFYTRYYDKNRLFSMGTFDLSLQETYDEISSVIYNLESINGIENIIDTDFLKKQVLEDLDKPRHKEKK